jgi:nicotinamidase/pyrazinamidase
MGKRALIVVDVQRDFLPGGALAVPHGDQVIPVFKALIGSGRYDGIVFTQDWHPANHGSFASVAGVKPFESGNLNGLPQVFWPDHCVQGTPGAAIEPELLAAAAKVVMNAQTQKADDEKLVATVQKGADRKVDSYSGFYDNGKVNATALHDTLHQFGVTDLDIGGLATDYCVGWTAEDAIMLGYKVRVIEDASRGIDATGSQAMLEKLAALGVKVVGSGEI